MPTPPEILEAAATRRHYDNLLKTHKELKEKLIRAEADRDRYKGGYEFYMLIQKACQESPVVAGEFQRFLMTCKLVEENDDGTPGLTAPEGPKPIDYQMGFGF